MNCSKAAISTGRSSSSACGGVTTRSFLKAFGLANLRDLPEIERLEDEGLLQRPGPEAEIDSVFGAGEEDPEAIDVTEDNWEKRLGAG